MKIALVPATVTMRLEMLINYRNLADLTSSVVFAVDLILRILVKALQVIYVWTPWLFLQEHSSFF